MSQPPLRPPSGTRDFLPDEMRRREAVITRIKRVFAKYGYEPMDTPAFERIEVLAGKYGEEGDKLIFKILKRGAKAQDGGADLALRYDLTVPAVRLYAHQRGTLPRIFKRYQIGPVWRADRPGLGRFREFYQCDVDVFGSDSPLADVDVILTCSAALEAVGLSKFTIRLNSRRVLHAMMDAYGIAPERHGEVLTVLDKLDKIGADGVAAELADRGYGHDKVGPLHTDLARPDIETVLHTRIAGSNAGRACLAEVDAILAAVAPAISAGAIRFDPFLARGLDYYTGAIYEWEAGGAGGSIAGGGRYDDLAGMFMKGSVPICGASLGIERILMLKYAEQTLDMKPKTVYVTIWDKNAIEDSQELAKRLRADTDDGIAVEIDVTGNKLERQFKVADKRGCLLALVRGPDERTAQTVGVKDLRTGKQTPVPLSKLADHVRRLLES